MESKQNIGTKITITLSFLYCRKKGCLWKARNQEASLKKEKPRRILLAEDNALNAEIALELLKGAGFLVGGTPQMAKRVWICSVTQRMAIMT